MRNQNEKIKSGLVLLPVVGSLLFVILYFIATLLYPGGSYADKNAVGFSWANNYWCNLLNENAINGQHNSAKPVAMTAMLVLCLTLTFFWFLFPRHVDVSRRLKLIIQTTGTIAMTVSFFLFTDLNHDLIIDVACVFGLIATVGVFIGLYKEKWLKLLTLGLVNILLVIANNYFYYSKDLIIYLPIVQKISFAFFLIWICCVDLNLYRVARGNNHERFP